MALVSRVEWETFVILQHLVYQRKQKKKEVGRAIIIIYQGLHEKDDRFPEKHSHMKLMGVFPGPEMIG